ncbi:MAG: thymidine kinase [Patescibacteria group bacterium]
MPASLTFFTGPMACGKTLELVRHLQIYAEQRVPTVCLRPATDTRSDVIRSRSGLSYDGLTIPADDLDALRRALTDYAVIGLDEAQFFSPDVVPLLHDALRQGKTILISGLDTDFRGEVFPTALALMALPETIVERSRAVCSVCREHNASRTQRLKNGEPASANEPIVAVEGAEATITYEPRCLAHHVIR